MIRFLRKLINLYQKKRKVTCFEEELNEDAKFYYCAKPFIRGER